MKLATAALGLLLTLVAGTALAQAQTGSVITERPRDPGITRDAYQDSTMSGGTGWNFPSRKTPPVMPPPPAPTPDPCADPNAAGCGGTPATDPFDDMFGGCVIDTRAFDLFETPNCQQTGETDTHAIGFSVGDRAAADYAYFADPNAYRVEWTGVCAGFSGSYCSVGGLRNGDHTVTATIFSVASGARLGTLTITAAKDVRDGCMPSDTRCSEPL